MDFDKPEREGESLAETLALLKERQSKNTAAWEKISKILLGNGDDGLVSMVKELKRNMAVIKWIGGALFVSTLGIFVTLVVNLFLLHGQDLLR